MKVGVPKEVKNREYRVALTPTGVHELVQHGHEVVVQKTAGEGSQIGDEEYVAAGAKMLDTADDVWGSADMILKVKEPIAEEYGRMREGQTLFTYLHLAADKPLTEALLARKVTAIAYETVQLPSGGLPLLYPMSDVAGCLAPQVGAYSLMKANGPRCPDGRRGWRGQRQGRHHRCRRLGPERGQHRARHGRRRHPARHRPRQAANVVLRYSNRLRGLASSKLAIEQQVMEADMVIGAVLIPGAAAPKLVSNDLMSRMKPGSVLVDIAIDQGGCFEDSHATTHDDPTYKVHDSVF